MMHLRMLVSWGAAAALAACAAGGGVARNDAPPAPVLDSGAQVAENFVASTNEPFWQATVDGGKLVLKGIEGDRSLRVTRNEALFDGRVVSAEDPKGMVEVRIAPTACQDDMSGQDYPYTARLTLEDGRPIRGCARPLATEASPPRE